MGTDSMHKRSRILAKWRSPAGFVLSAALVVTFAMLAVSLLGGAIRASAVTGVAGSKSCDTFVTLGSTQTCTSFFTNNTTSDTPGGGGGTLSARTDTFTSPVGLAGQHPTSPTAGTTQHLNPSPGPGNVQSPSDTWTFQIPNDGTLCGVTAVDTVSASLAL